MEIILYSTGCPKCNVLKKKLAEKDITYNEFTSVEGMLSMGINEVPMLKAGDKLMHFKEAVDWIKEQ